MGELVCLLLVGRGMDSSVISMKDIINPQKFQLVAAAVKKLAGYDGVSQFKSSSLVLKVGSNLKKCAEVLSGLAIDEDDDELITKCEEFIKCYDCKWSENVSSLVIGKKFNKPKYLIIVEEFQKLNTFIEIETEKCHEKIICTKKELEQSSIDNKQCHKKATAQRAWCRLAKLTLSSLILFNNKRSSEAQRLTINNFEEGMKATSVSPDLQEVYTDLEKSLSKHFITIEIRGKRGGIPVLMSKNHVTHIRLLLSMRSMVGVCSSNTYVFARPNYGSVNMLSGSAALRCVAREANLTKREILVSRNLRTMNQILKLLYYDFLSILIYLLFHTISIDYKVSEVMFVVLIACVFCKVFIRKMYIF